jgi:hypothetical protein
MLLLACIAESTQPMQNTPAENTEPPLAAPENGIQLGIGPVTLEPYQELYWCKTMRLPNTEPLDVIALEHQVTTGAHHYNVWGLLGGPEDLEAPCDEIWAETSMSLGSPLYASQEPTFYGEFPEGVAASLPPSLLVLQELHFINTTDAPKEVTGTINIHTAPEGSELIYANGLFGSNNDLLLPPNETTVLTQNCKVPVDIEVFVLGSHFHSRGKKFEIRVLDKAGNPSELVYTSTDYSSPLLDIRADNPISIKAGGGFSYSCTFENTTDAPIEDGENSDQEMCMMVGIYYPDQGFLMCEN